MRSQRALRLDERALEGLWSLIPVEHRQRAQTQLGRVVAKAAREETRAQASQTQEEHDEPGIE
jgi:hypothetical protein